MRLASEGTGAGKAFVVDDTTLLVVVDRSLDTSPRLLLGLRRAWVVGIGDIIFCFTLLALLVCLMITRVSFERR